MGHFQNIVVLPDSKKKQPKQRTFPHWLLNSSYSSNHEQKNEEISSISKTKTWRYNILLPTCECPWPVECCCFVVIHLVTSAGRKNREDARTQANDRSTVVLLILVAFFIATRTSKNRRTLKSFVSHVCWSLHMQFRCTAVVLKADTGILFRLLHYFLFSHLFPLLTLSVRVLFFKCHHVITRYYPVFMHYFAQNFPCHFFRNHHWNSKYFYPQFRVLVNSTSGL
jgi:hypothetical protein